MEKKKEKNNREFERGGESVMMRILYRSPGGRPNRIGSPRRRAPSSPERGGNQFSYAENQGEDVNLQGFSEKPRWRIRKENVIKKS